jgi:hypothetical protein
MTVSHQLHVVVDRITGDVVVPLGVWEDPEAAAEEIAEHDPAQPGRYEVRIVLDGEGLTDDTFAEAEHGPSEIPVSPIATLVDGTLLTEEFFAKISGARCTFAAEDGTVCGALILTDETTSVTPTGDVLVPSDVWAGWAADRCAEHLPT